ncbi:MAG: indolepyruvate ferredoxin oxidoreductase family protein, partial [Rhodospirillales bacterium]|nr:indolepyruvate ferredoxin oxidoreductase family protein [Rhodospirillales bacterium]
EAESLEDLMARHEALLIDYQDAAYGARYRALLATVQAKGEDDLSRAIASGYFKALTYKDEYEVARLFTDGAFSAELDKRLANKGRVTYHMAPPFLGPQKRAFGPW